MQFRLDWKFNLIFFGVKVPVRLDRNLSYSLKLKFRLDWTFIPIVPSYVSGFTFRSNGWTGTGTGVKVRVGLKLYKYVLWMCFLELQFRLDRTESKFGRDFEDF